MLFFILGYFLPFYPPNSLKNQNSKKKKKSLETSSFYNGAPKIMIIWYTVPEIWCMTDVIVIFHFGLFFSLLQSKKQSKKSRFKKMKKTPGDIIILLMYAKNYDQMMYGSWDRVHDGRTDRQLDRWKKLHGGRCPT